MSTNEKSAIKRKEGPARAGPSECVRTIYRVLRATEWRRVNTPAGCAYKACDEIVMSLWPPAPKMTGAGFPTLFGYDDSYAV